MITDDLTKGQLRLLKSAVQEVQISAEPFLDAVETVFRVAKIMSVGLEDEVNAVDRLIRELRARLDYRLENGAWSSIVDETSLASASASARQPAAEIQPPTLPNSSEQKKAK